METKSVLKWVAIGVTLFIILIAGSCSIKTIETNPGTVTVIGDSPYFIGHGGVRDEVQRPGRSWYWKSTWGIDLPDTPFQINEPFDDLLTSNQNFIDFHSFLQFRITDHSLLIKNFGTSWYDNNLKKQYGNIVRDEARKYTMSDILTGQETTSKMEANIRREMDKLITEKKIPVQLMDISLGRASPNQPVIEEMNRTTAQQQRKKTEIEREKAEDSRKEAEIARAAADSAYNAKMNLSTEEYVRLETAKLYAGACAHTSGGCTLIQGNMPLALPTGTHTK